MKTKYTVLRIVVTGLLALLGAGIFPGVGLAQVPVGDKTLWFEETGHVVSKGFLDYFEATGGLEVHGYPLTEPFTTADGVIVQYFQKSRIQYDPNVPNPRISLGPLGKELGYGTPPVSPPAFPSRRRVYYPQTGHTLSYAFLNYVKDHGGVEVFGYPITEMFIEEGRIVQYFENLKLEWHPDDRANPVHVGNLGEEYINRYRDRILPQALKPLPDPRGNTTLPTQTAPVSNLKALLSLRYSVMGNNGSQVVTVLVRDGVSKGVKSASVVISLINAQGKTLYESRPLTTNDQGYVREEIQVTGGKIGERIIVKATITYGNLKTETQNTFLIWW